LGTLVQVYICTYLANKSEVLLLLDAAAAMGNLLERFVHQNLFLVTGGKMSTI
jgi:hypothetical protein